MVLRRFSFVLALALLVSTTGCAAFIGRAKKSYTEGRYLETEERLSKHEPDLPYLANDKQCLYGLYRGLALLALGDGAGAQRWLGFSLDIERQNPGSLRPEQRAMLDRAWADLAAAPRAAPRSAPEAVPPPLAPPPTAPEL